MQKILKYADAVNRWVGRLSSYTIVALTLFVVMEVILRKVFNSPTIWSFDLTKQLYALLFMLTAGYTLLHEEHVSIDIVSKRFSEKVQAVFQIIGYVVFFFPFWLVVIWAGTKFAAKSWMIFETSVGLFPMPLYFIKTVIPLSALLLCIQGFATLLRKILILKNS